MNRLLILLLIVLTGTPFASAAEFSGVGIRFGLNIAGQTGSEHFFLYSDDEYTGGSKDNRLGFCVGGFIIYQVTDWFAIQPEVLISVKGSKFDESGKSTETDSLLYVHEINWENRETWKMSCLEIPLLAKFTLPGKRAIKPHLTLGPVLSLNLGSKVDWSWSGTHVINGSLQDAWEDASKDDIDGLNNVNWCYLIGFGIDFDLKASRIIVDVRYTADLTENDSYSVEFDNPEWGHYERNGLNLKNNVVAITFGYMFNL